MKEVTIYNIRLDIALSNAGYVSKSLLISSYPWTLKLCEKDFYIRPKIRRIPEKSGFL